jgi:hypothetical protein
MQKEAAGSKPNIDILKGFFGIGVQYNWMRCCSIYWNIFLYCGLWTKILWRNWMQTSQAVCILISSLFFSLFLRYSSLKLISVTNRI